MIQADWETFRIEMGLLCETYDRKRTSEIDDAYWSALTKMPLRDFRRAALWAREKSGHEGFERLPKPGKFWGFRDDSQRAERVQSGQSEQQTQKLSRAQHLLHLRRTAIECAKRETMPKFKDKITAWQFIPESYRGEYKSKWEQWEKDYDNQDWWPRARELMIKFGERRPDDVLSLGVPA